MKFPSASGQSTRAVLVLDESDGNGSPFDAEIFFGAAREPRQAAPIMVYVENLYLGPFSGNHDEESLPDHLRMMWLVRLVTVIVTVGAAALDFAQRCCCIILAVGKRNPVPAADCVGATSVAVRRHHSDHPTRAC